jgi:hypothetical protein
MTAQSLSSNSGGGNVLSFIARERHHLLLDGVPADQAVAEEEE